MNDNTSYREKGRAVFLAAIMVLSVVAMSAAFAGSAAAEATNVTANDIDGTTNLDVTVDHDDYTDGNVTIAVAPTGDAEYNDSSDHHYIFEEDGGDASGEDTSFSDDLGNAASGEEYTVYAVGSNDSVVDGPSDEDDLSEWAEAQDSFEIYDSSLGPDSTTFEVNGDNRNADIVYQGEDLIALNSTEFSESGETYNLREVDDFDQGSVDGSSQVEQVTTTTNESGAIIVEIDTDDLDAGDYFIRGGDLPREPDLDETFEIAVQDLTAEFDDDEVTDEGDGAVTELEVNSPRGSWDMNVSADGDLDADELADIFGYGDLSVTTVDDDEDRITLSGVSDGDYDVSFDGIDTDEYEFDFESVDTGAETTASITVTEHDMDGSFSQGVYTQTAGDYQQFTLELEDTDEAWIQIGDENAGFVDVVHVEDGDDNGEVSFWVNTRHLGNAPGDVADSSLVYWSDEDEVESLFHDGSLSEGVTFEEDDGSPLTYEGYLDELGIIDESEDSFDEQLTRPLQPTDYSLTASADGVFIADGGESEADNELDQSTLDLVEPEIGEINTYVAPAEDADDADLEELLSEVELTERTEVAEDDRLVIEVEATGLYGALGAASGEPFSIMSDGASAEGLYELAQNDGVWESEGINFDVEADDAIGNQDPTFLDLDTDEDDEVYVLVDNENGAFYVVVDSGADVWDGGLDTPHEFDVDFEYETDDDERFRFDGGADVAYPYFGTDSDESVSTTFDVVDPAVEFNNLDADDNVQIETSDSAVISGETNVAPGTESDIRVRNAGDTPSFLNTPSAEIDSDGSFESEEVDFSDRAEDDEATITFRVGGSSVDSADGIFVEAVEETDDEPPEEDDEPPEEDDEPPETDDEPPETDDDPAPPTDDTADDTEDDGVPGFGLAIAVVALLAAAMLALRRQN